MRRRVRYGGVLSRAGMCKKGFLRRCRDARREGRDVCVNRYAHDASGCDGRLRRMWESGVVCGVWTCAEGGGRGGAEEFGGRLVWLDRGKGLENGGERLVRRDCAFWRWEIGDTVERRGSGMRKSVGG